MGNNDEAGEIQEDGSMGTPSERRAINLALMARDVRTTRDDVKDIKQKLENNYVTKEEFKLVQRIVYGFVGLTVLTVFGALLALVVNTGAK